MASTGLPVFADEFTYCPGYLFTSMLAADDLSSETSYFLAEVERLVLMMDYVKAHPNTLLILDEILKGTNSHDKEEGSKLFIERLISEQATALIATHDVNLTSMNQTYPQITNHSFEVEHVNGEMVFDFTLRNGVVQNLNAMELMKIKGLLPNA